MNLEIGGLYRLLCFIQRFQRKQVQISYSNEKIKNIIKLKTLSAFSI
mgnify:CR=1 FL=1